MTSDEPANTPTELNWGTPPPAQGPPTPNSVSLNSRWMGAIVIVLLGATALISLRLFIELIITMVAAVLFLAVPFESACGALFARRAGAKIRQIQLAFWTAIVEDGLQFRWTSPRYVMLMAGRVVAQPVPEPHIPSVLSAIYTGRIIGAALRAVVSFVVLATAVRVFPDTLDVWALLPLVVVITPLPYVKYRFQAELRGVLRRGGPPADRLVALESIDIASANGVRPRDWNPEWITRMLALHDDSRWEVMAYWNAHHPPLDADNIDAARAFLDHAMRLIDERHPHYKSVYGPSAGFIAAFYDDDARTARTLTTNLVRVNIEQRTRNRIEAAILLAERRYPEALALAREGLSQSPPALDPGMAQMDIDYLNAIISRIQSIQDGTADSSPTPTLAAW